MVLKKETNLYNDYRKRAIVEYVRNNSECQKEEVINYCEKNGIGSRATIWNKINELRVDNILNVITNEDDARAYKLIISEGNLLLLFPAQCEKIFSLFKHYVRAMKTANMTMSKISYNSIDSNFRNMRRYDKFEDFAPTLSFSLIDIINEYYTFYFMFILPNQIYPQKHTNNLYAIYFEYLMKMYSYANGMFLRDQAGEIADIKKSELYLSHIETKSIQPFAKICNLARASSALNIENELFKLLDYLWKCNVEIISLLYTPISDETIAVICEGILKVNNDNFKYDDDSDILQKIHMVIYVVNQFQDSILQHLPRIPPSFPNTS